MLSQLGSLLSWRTDSRYPYPHVSDDKNEALVTKHFACCHRSEHLVQSDDHLASSPVCAILGRFIRYNYLRGQEINV